MTRLLPLATLAWAALATWWLVGGFFVGAVIAGAWAVATGLAALTERRSP